MSDMKYFTTTKKGEIPELKEELNNPDKKRKIVAMKKVIANMTMGNDMSSLFPDALACMQTPALELKKMVYLYVVTYAKTKPELALLCVNSFIRDTEDINPLIRGLAIRTMSYIEVDKIIEAMAAPLRKCLKDQDPYVRKTAALCVAKLHKYQPSIVEEEGFLDSLRDLLNDPNTMVVANTLAALREIDIDREDGIDLRIDYSVVMKYLTALNECPEWGQVYIIEVLTQYTPKDSNEAETIAERVGPRLNHANSSVILSAIKVIMHCMPYFSSESVRESFSRKISPSLVTLLRSGLPEIQYVALRNILLLMQKRPEILAKEMKVFFCEYNDPIYVKMTKLEVLIRIANDNNVENILAELKEYATEIDVEFVRKSVRAMGICAVKMERAADRCIEVLLELIQTQVNYVVQEAIVVIKDIFRKYPNRYENIIGTLCENLDTLDEPDAKASMIWIIGQYADRIDNADELLATFSETFLEEPTEVQLALLTAIVKLFLKRPNDAELIKKVFKWGTEVVENPDLRDRAFIYWRLLSTDPMAAKAIVFSNKPLSTEGTIENLEPNILQEVIAHIGSLASIYHKPPSAFLAEGKHKKLPTLPVERDDKDSKEKIDPRIAAPSNQVSVLSGNDDYMQMGQTAGASVGGVGNIMNLLDLDLDEPQYNDSEMHSNSSSNMDDMLGDLNLGNPYGQQQFQQPPQQQPDSLSGLDFGYNPNQRTPSSGNLLNSLVLEQRFVKPKQVLLSAKNAQGLEINGTFARRSGTLFLDLTFTNKAMQPMGDFGFQFNKNSFGIVPGAPLEVRTPLLANTSAETSLPLTFSPIHVQVKDPINLLQIAVKNNVSVFYFQTNLHLHILFPENGGVERSEYLRLWKEIPETNEKRTEISNLNFDNSETIRNKLSLNNVFTVAERQVDDRTLIYCSTSVLPEKQVFLLELNFDPSFKSCSCSIKSTAIQLMNPFEEAIIGILHSQ